MMTPSKMTGVLAVLAAVAPLGVSAHGYMSVPKVTFATSGDPTQFCATLDGPSTLTAPSGMSFTTDPESNTKAFAAAFKAQSTYKSMRALVDAKGVFQPGMDKQCGVTSATGAKQPLPAKYVEWAHSSSEGFTPSHQGPCEVWCDNTRVFQDDNCAKDYTTAPALLPYDRSKCVGASMLKIYWLALHSSTWQAYINCAPLEGGSSSGASASTGSDAATPSVTPATASASSDNEYDDEYATPAPATTAPSSSSAEEDCDDELDLAGSEASGSVGAEEDCDDELDLAGSDEVGADADAEVGADADPTAASGSEDCDDELDIAGSDASGSEDCDDDLSLAGSDEAAGSDSAVTTAPETTSSPATITKAPSTTTKTPKPTKTKKTKTPKPTKTKKTKTPKPTKTKNEASGSVGAEEDCDDELDIAGSEASGSEDCDDELDIAGSEAAAAATTSSLNFDSLSSNDASEVGTVDAY
uniref:SCP domain-containing protein n=1 Tax=Globisporangium ultimum (strain ATCC 200006 / CBS 805.95 / DAOM BR144) TaxID=431595 RepID=K3W973_GLOUD